MSIRQMGLIKALDYIVPEASSRYWRHLWRTFKQRWSGEAFKFVLRAAAKATTHNEFEEKMNKLKKLSKEVHDYMASIPPTPSAWNRHAFDTNCKSNMLVNNMCESFNHVLKPARDKPILRHMERMRRYTMQRNHSKREGVLALEGGLKVQHREALICL